MIKRNLFHIYVDKYFMAVTMVFGSMIAGKRNIFIIDIIDYEIVFRNIMISCTEVVKELQILLSEVEHCFRRKT